MISQFEVALGASNSENQREVMHVKSDLENFLKEKIAYYGFVKEGITKQ